MLIGVGLAGVSMADRGQVSGNQRTLKMTPGQSDQTKCPAWNMNRMTSLLGVATSRHPTLL
jgi:hypothetical protein